MRRWSAKLEAAGLADRRGQGAELRGACLAEGGFSVEEVATRRGVFAQIEDCYLLAYLCKKPG